MGSKEQERTVKGRGRYGNDERGPISGKHTLLILLSPMARWNLSRSW